MNVDGATEHGGDARGGIFYRADCAPLGDRMLLVISRLDSSTWQPARPNCIAGGEQRLSPRTPLVERGTSPRCSPHPEHTAHVSDLPRCCPARPQLVWSVAHMQRSSMCCSCPSAHGSCVVAPWAMAVVFGSPDISVSRCARASVDFSRDMVAEASDFARSMLCVCVNRVRMRLRRHRNASRVASNDGMVRSDRACWFVQCIHPLGAFGGGAQSSY